MSRLSGYIENQHVKNDINKDWYGYVFKRPRANEIAERLNKKLNNRIKNKLARKARKN